MEIRALSGEALGVEVLNADLRTATADDIERMVDAMHRTGRGVVVVRDQHLRPLDCERACALLAPHFVAQQPYTRWPGQSKPIPGCPHLALLGNYRARENGEFGMDVVKGEVPSELSDTVDEKRMELIERLADVDDENSDLVGIGSGRPGGERRVSLQSVIRPRGIGPR